MQSIALALWLCWVALTAISAFAWSLYALTWVAAPWFVKLASGWSIDVYFNMIIIPFVSLLAAVFAGLGVSAGLRGGGWFECAAGTLFLGAALQIFMNRKAAEILMAPDSFEARERELKALRELEGLSRAQRAHYVQQGRFWTQRGTEFRDQAVQLSGRGRWLSRSAPMRMALCLMPLLGTALTIGFAWSRNEPGWLLLIPVQFGLPVTAVHTWRVTRRLRVAEAEECERQARLINNHFTRLPEIGSRRSTRGLYSGSQVRSRRIYRNWCARPQTQEGASQSGIKQNSGNINILI